MEVLADKINVEDFLKKMSLTDLVQLSFSKIIDELEKKAKNKSIGHYNYLLDIITNNFVFELIHKKEECILDSIKVIDALVDTEKTLRDN